MGAAAESPATRRTVRLLDYDPELGATMRPERLPEAQTSAEATVVEVGRGVRSIEEMTAGHDSVYGVMLLDGLVNRTVVLDGVVSAQLLGHGDLVRVGDIADEALVETQIRWAVLEPLTAALLDEPFLLTVRRWPELVAALFQRLAAQEERRDVHRALSQLPRVEDRIHALMWMLAERWGHVSPDGVTLRLRLTHELIGQLVGARRPTVSLALKQLEERGSVHRRADGSWLLEQAWTVAPTGDPGAAHEGAGIVPPESPMPAGPRPGASVVEDIRARVERMRRLHSPTRDELAGTLARTAATRERSSALRRD